MTDTEEKKSAVRKLNDDFRKSFVGGRVALSRGILGVSLELRREIIRAVQSYSEWEPGNERHDFGTVQIQAQKFFWKIDYLDMQLEYESSDPVAAVTRRVLTIMTASEN